MSRNTVQYRVVGQGQGGFLNPPLHPEHTMSVQEADNRGFVGQCNLSTVLAEDYYPEYIKTRVKSILDEYEANKPLLTDPLVVDWIHNVLGYFKGCWRAYGRTDDKAWDITELVMSRYVNAYRDPVLHADDHAGVHLIRKYYPEYVPTQSDFDNAYWGTKRVVDSKEERA